MLSSTKMLSSTQLQVFGVVAFYMSAALVMVFVNKAVLTSDPDLPLVFLLLQLLIAVALLHLSTLVSKSVEIPRITLDATKKLFPVVFVNITGLAFNILCLRGVEASFFQIARGLVLPLTILVSWLHTPTNPVSVQIIAASAVVTCGFFLGVAPSAAVPLSSTPSFVSLFYGVLSSLFIAVHAVLIKTSLPYCSNSTIQLAWWTNAGSALLLLPVVLFAGEFSVLQNKLYDGQWNATVFLYGSLITGIFGFLLCIGELLIRLASPHSLRLDMKAGLLSIRVTSPITHMFSSAARSVLQTLIGVAYFGDLINTAQEPRRVHIGYSRRNYASIRHPLAVSPTNQLEPRRLYTWIKAAEAKKPPQPAPVDLEAQETDKLDLHDDGKE
ncbi:TPT domain-containing protein [Mycena chlorophos]|uniref:TPT domain-containing protein n=1 Tax=Mycena chlorophos TaxID=658473 RepID=A0A8H6W9U4_MYCCL|nr:TPT domain-containing protein [Mycena chlorophos]